MRIILITQSDPFYLAPNIKYLIKSLPNHSKIVATVLLEVSPFGKQESFIKKIKRTHDIFGSRFFIYYGFRYFISMLNPKQSVEKVLTRKDINIIRLKNSINHSDSISQIKSFSPDLLISIAGNQIFKKVLIDLAPKGCLNLHTSLLPKYRGLMPSFWVLKNNEKETGVSLFFVDEGIDSGPIIVQKRIPISEEMTQAELIKLSKKIGMKIIIEAINLINRGDYQLISNPEKEKTYFSFPTRKDVKEFYKAGKRFY